MSREKVYVLNVLKHAPLKGNIGSSYIAQLGAYLDVPTVMSISWWLTQLCLYGSVGSTSLYCRRLVLGTGAVKRNFADCYLLVTPGMASPYRAYYIMTSQM